MGSTYDQQQTEALNKLASDSKKESRKTFWILAIAILTLAVTGYGVFFK